MSKKETIEELRRRQRCFPSEGYMWCNFRIIKGKAIYPKKKGGMLRWPLLNHKKAKIKNRSNYRKVKRTILQ